MSEDDDLPRLLGGRYRLEATLGHGGMGVVYRGLDLMMKRPIAVKLIRAVDGVELDDEIAGRFLREAKNTARVQHEHIIEVFDLGRTEEGGLYFVMELLDGESLSSLLRRDGALDPKQTVHIARQICEALQVAHTAGVIHRDLKPANVMLLKRAGDDRFVKVLDFGVAKSYSSDMETQLTHTGMLVGTVDYMAPEQIMGKPVDGRTDIYSLGIVLYKMLSGRPPFRDNGVPALIHAHLNMMPQPLIEIAKGVPNELDHVVLRCMAKSPDRRFESMAELARALVAATSPDDLGLTDLEYHPEDDPYSIDDQTTVARPQEGPTPPLPAPLPAAGAPPPARRTNGGGRPRPAPVATPAPRPRERDLRPLPDKPLSRDDDTTINEDLRSVLSAEEDDDASQFDDATIKIDRPLDLKKAPSRGVPLPMTPRGAPRLYPEDVATARRAFPPDEPTRSERHEPRTCAMCQTVNPTHARACMACGVSLAMEDQDAVRARVRAIPRPSPSSAPPPPRLSSAPPPRTSSSPPGRTSSAPPPPTARLAPLPPPLGMPTASVGPYDAVMRSAYPSVPVPPTPGHGIPIQGIPPWIPPPPPPPPPPSMWERFLTWTGLRGR